MSLESDNRMENTTLEINRTLLHNYGNNIVLSKLKEKLTRNDRHVDELFRQYRGGDDWPTPTASNKFIALLEK